LPSEKGEEWRVFTPRTLCSSILATLTRDALPAEYKYCTSLPSISTKLFQSTAINVAQHAKIFANAIESK
jgi:hypothetical protein